VQRIGNRALGIRPLRRADTEPLEEALDPQRRRKVSRVLDLQLTTRDADGYQRYPYASRRMRWVPRVAMLTSSPTRSVNRSPRHQSLDRYLVGFPAEVVYADDAISPPPVVERENVR
jgi:hypothetical protein